MGRPGPMLKRSGRGGMVFEMPRLLVRGRRVVVVSRGRRKMGGRLEKMLLGGRGGIFAGP